MVCFRRSNSNAWDLARRLRVSRSTASSTKTWMSRKPNVSSTNYDPGNDRIPYKLRLPHLGAEDGDYLRRRDERGRPVELGRAQNDGTSAYAAGPHSRRTFPTFPAAGRPCEITL